MELSSRRLADLRARANRLPVALQMGKAVLTDAFVAEVDVWLKRDRLVKLRLRASATAQADRRELARDLAERTGAVLVQVKGNTVVLFRSRR